MLRAPVYCEKIGVLHAGLDCLERIMHGIMEMNLGSVLLVYGNNREVMINRDCRGHTYCEGRGEIQ